MKFYETCSLTAVRKAFELAQIHRVSWNPQVNYRIHNSQPPLSIHRQINPVHAPLRHIENPF